MVKLCAPLGRTFHQQWTSLVDSPLTHSQSLQLFFCGNAQLLNLAVDAEEPPIKLTRWLLQKLMKIIGVQNITVHYSTTKGCITLYVTHWKVALHKVSVVLQDKFHFAIAKCADLKSNPPRIFKKRVIHYLFIIYYSLFISYYYFPLRKMSKKNNSMIWTCCRL